MDEGILLWILGEIHKEVSKVQLSSGNLVTGLGMGIIILYWVNITC